VPITESLGALGKWDLTLRASTPREIRDQLQYFGHITVHTGRVQPELVGDGLLASSRYTGVLRGKGESDEGFDLTGCGMEFWLGDEDDKGVVIEDPLTFTAETYTQTVRDLLALTTSVTEGTFHAVTGTFTNTFQYMVLRKAIGFVTSTGGIEYRVNGDASMDLGLVSDLYVTDPKCFVVKRNAGVDMDLRAFRGNSDVDSDVEDFTTRVVLLAASTDITVATGDADIAPGLNPFKDLHGQPVKLTRMVSESTTDSTNADARAQLQLNRFSDTRDALTLSTQEYDIAGSVRIGDYLWVFNPDIGLVDLNNEAVFRGELMNPIKLRLIETTWPVAPGFMVAYRDPNGVWLDLTDYVMFESGQTAVKVGGYNRSLVGSSTEVIGRLPQPDLSVPDVVEWVEPFTVGVYQSPTTGIARGDVRLTWTRPDNTDSTPIVDGSHYEIRYRRATTPMYPITNDMIENLGLTNDQLDATGATNDHMILFPETDWQFANAPFDVEAFVLQELVPAMPYEVQIRAVDLASPPNQGAWSELVQFLTTKDDIPPATPAAPSIAASTLAVQMTHELGVASGGTFNLDRDMHHMELHGGVEPLFTPTDDTLLGKVLANWGMISGHIPLVATFPLDNLSPVYFKVIAVDEAGNKSLPSSYVVATAELVDDAHISNLTVSKVTAGTITSDWVMAGSIKTGDTPNSRTEMDHTGIRLYADGDFLRVNLDATSGDALFTGKVQTGAGVQRIVVDPNTGDGYSRIDMYDDGSTDHVTFLNQVGTFFQRRERNSDRGGNGGYLTYQTSSSFFGHQNFGGAESYIGLGNGGVNFKGFFNKTLTIGGLGALYIDQIGGSGGSESFTTVTYGATMATTPLPFISCQPTSGSTAHRLFTVGSRSTTQFTIYQTQTNNALGTLTGGGNYDILIWAIRYA
jgi:hypothetical protein